MISNIPEEIERILTESDLFGDLISILTNAPLRRLLQHLGTEQTFREWVRTSLHKFSNNTKKRESTPPVIANEPVEQMMKVFKLYIVPTRFQLSCLDRVRVLSETFLTMKTTSKLSDSISADGFQYRVENLTAQEIELSEFASAKRIPRIPLTKLEEFVKSMVVITESNSCKRIHIAGSMILALASSLPSTRFGILHVSEVEAEMQIDLQDDEKRRKTYRVLKGRPTAVMVRVPRRYSVSFSAPCTIAVLGTGIETVFD